jgi:hypothetical protein
VALYTESIVTLGLRIAADTMPPPSIQKKILPNEQWATSNHVQSRKSVADEAGSS